MHTLWQMLEQLSGVDSQETLTGKILRAHGVQDVTPGAYGLARPDLVLLNEVSGAMAIRAFAQMGAERVFDPARVALVIDHFVPAKDTNSAELANDLRRFARRYGIEQLWEVGVTADAGIEHTLLPELGFVAPGDFIPGGDSHTCTYGAFGALGTGVGSTDIAAALALGEVWVRVPEVVRVSFAGWPGPYTTGKDLILAYLGEVGTSGATYASLEFEGPAVQALDIEGRMALCNMSVEAGAKSGLVAADETTLAWLRGRVDDAALRPLAAGPDARYDATTVIEVEGLEPLVARPPSPADVIPISEIPAGTRVDQVYVGNCANGTIADLRQLALILEGRTTAPGTRLIVVPATQSIYRRALAEGILDTVVAAGGLVSPPTCGACFGGHMGILGAGETAVATTNRNFRGRMGHRDSEVFLANAYVAGAAAVAGELVSPADVLGR
jgi:3-isopropylmalate/(R)-2-methylmalate dehydratase large subunit